jgi:polysaccharide deacetylase family protein (PEP-CTERM system associated)
VSSGESSPRFRNYLTVDLEEWFHIGEEYVPSSEWDSLPSRIEKNIEDLLQFLDEHHTRATFFVLGWVAERHPDLVRRVCDGGHTIASHGYSHLFVHRLTPAEFEADLTRSLSILEGITGRRPIGYRAPCWSLGRGALWALPILAKRGIRYDSSIVPSPIIGNTRFPREPYRISNNGSSLTEYPMLVGDIGVRGMMLGGGWGFRLLSLSIVLDAVEKLNSRGIPALFNIHPWELDPSPPRVDLPAVPRFVHYAGLSGFRDRLAELLRHISLGPIPE